MILLQALLPVSLFLLFPAIVLGGEECSMVGGMCRDACAADEYAEVGAFLDCTEKQECCVKKEVKPAKDILQPEDAGRKGKE
jgi:hypothetical protein